jgi:hypothetical protein
MANGARPAGERGIRVVRSARVRRDVWAVVVVGLGLTAGVVLLRSDDAPGRPAEPPPAPRAAAPAPAPPAPSRLADAGVPAGPGDQPSAPPTLPTTMPKTLRGKLRALKALGVTPTRGPDGRRQVDTAQVIDALNAAGIHEGIAAFGRPGTDPPKPGIIVPDDYQLPEGYVRHYQTTDDGQPLPPILMFHPDYTFVDQDGKPVEIPADRVVPPELAPPDLPIDRLRVPAPSGRTR